VLLVPKGLVPTLGDLGQWLLTSRGRRAKRLEPKQAEEG
jgi:branched-chain amino acid transport system permease protein